MSSAVKTVFGGSDDSAQEATQEQNRASAQYTKEQAEQARKDAMSLFPAAEKNILAGGQAAMDLLGGLVPQQIDAMRAGSTAARNAILGTGQGEVDFTPDYSILQQILPSLRNPADRFGSAASIEGSPVYVDPNNPDAASQPEWLRGLTTNADLWRAASQGDIPDISPSDQAFWGAHLANVSAKEPDALGMTDWVSDPQGLLDRVVGVSGGFNPSNEQKAKRLIESIINPSGASTGVASRFLGG